jgi:hypothetical protein
MFRHARRVLVILWMFTRHRLWWAIYRDVVRSHLTNPDCGCEADSRLDGRARHVRLALAELGPTFIKLGQFLSPRSLAGCVSRGAVKAPGGGACDLLLGGASPVRGDVHLRAA